MSTQSTIAELKPPAPKDISSLPTVSVGFTSLQGFELAQRAAKLLASSDLVPKEYRSNIANCTIALNMAARVGADPLMVMQNLVIVHSKPTWSSQFLIATVNTCGRFSALRYEFFGKQGEDSWGCRAWAIEKATGEKLVGTDITIAIAKKEGWYGKNGSKWQTIPQQMLMYRAGSWWARAYAPELSMGLHTREEVDDYIDAERQEDGTYTVDMETLRREMKKQEPENIGKEIDPDTGEITERQVTEENKQAAESSPEPEPGDDAGDESMPQTFSLEDYRIDTVEGARRAAKHLMKIMEPYDDSQKAQVFLDFDGPKLREALGRKGLGAIARKFPQLDATAD